jgi:predicted dehydrogenase
MDRRSFTRLSALTLASTQLPVLAQSETSARPVGYAAIGLGTISEIFMRACAKSPTAKITALVTGHPEKGRRYAAMYGIPEASVYSYETFDRIRDNPAVDAVYIGLPNSMHSEYTLRAAAARKHVLCEKPMAISSAECRTMIAACRTANVKLMIAYRCHYDPTHLEAERIIQSGAIGRINAFEGAFGFNAKPGIWRLTRQLGGGGALMDMGIYPMNAMRYFTREEPSAFTAVASTQDHASGRFQDVEQTLVFTMKFPSGALATVSTAYGSNMPGLLRIYGDKGTLELSPAFSYSGIHLAGMAGASANATSPTEDTTHFQLEAEAFARNIRLGTAPLTPGEEGLKDMLAIEAIYRAAGSPIA